MYNMAGGPAWIEFVASHSKSVEKQTGRFNLKQGNNWGVIYGPGRIRTNDPRHVKAVS